MSCSLFILCMDPLIRKVNSDDTKCHWVAMWLSNKHDLQPELGSGLPGRWRPRPTLPGSRETRRECRLATLAWRKWRSRGKKSWGGNEAMVEQVLGGDG